MQRRDLLGIARDRVGMEVVAWISDLPGLLSLTQSIYPRSDIGDPRYIQWEYKQNPAGDACCHIGTLENQVVGTFAIIPIRFQIGGHSLVGSIPVNLMTHPNYRGLGVFPLLADSVLKKGRERGITFTIGLPNPYSHKGFIQDLNFKEIGHLPFWIFPISFPELIKNDRFKKHVLLGYILRVLSPLFRAYLLILRTLWRPASVEIEEVSKVDDSFDLFWEKVRKDYPNAVVRDKAYLHWRYVSHPTREYRITVARKGKAMVGYLIDRVDQILGIRSGLLVDLLVENTPDGQMAARELIRQATARFMAEGSAMAVSLMQKGTIPARALWRIGYWPCPQRFLPQPFEALVRWHSESSPPTELYDFTKWYYTMGDYDAV